MSGTIISLGFTWLIKSWNNFPWLLTVVKENCFEVPISYIKIPNVFLHFLFLSSICPVFSTRCTRYLEFECSLCSVGPPLFFKVLAAFLLDNSILHSSSNQVKFFFPSTTFVLGLIQVWVFRQVINITVIVKLWVCPYPEPLTIATSSSALIARMIVTNLITWHF